MALTVDTIESVLKARVSDYINDMGKAKAAYKSWYDEVNKNAGGDAGVRAVTVAEATKQRARKRTVDAAVADEGRLAAVVQRAVDRDNARTVAAERNSNRRAAAYNRELAAAQTKLMSGTSLSAVSAAPSASGGAGGNINYLLRDRIDLTTRLTAAQAAGDAKHAAALRDELAYLKLIEQYKRAGLSDDQAATRAEQQLSAVVKGRAEEEARAAQTSQTFTGRVANGYRNLGRQIADVGASLAGGQSPFLVLAQQAPQAADALVDVGKKSGAMGVAVRAATFFASPLGAALLAVGTIAGVMGSKLLFAEDGADKLKDATLTLTDALKANKYATDEGRKAIDAYNESQKGAAEQSILYTGLQLKEAEATLKVAQALREKLKAQLDSDRATASANAGQGTGGLAGAAAAGTLGRTEAAVRANEADILRLQTTATNLRNQIGNNIAKRASDPEFNITERYNNLRTVLNARLNQEKATTAEIARQNKLLNDRENAEKKALQERQKNERSSGTTAVLGSPVAGRVTSGLGARVAPKAGASTNHAGIDIAVPVGTPVRAGANGIVVSSGRLGALGNAIVVDYGSGTIARYGHLSQLIAKAGDRVAAGEVIGNSGNTGNSTGPHLHYEVRRNGRAVDPSSRVPIGNQDLAEARDATQAQRQAERAARKAEQDARRRDAEEDRAIRATESFNRDYETLQQSILDAQQNRYLSVADAARLERDLIESEYKKRQASIDSDLQQAGSDEQAKARAATLTALNDQLRILRLRNAKLKEDVDAIEEDGEKRRAIQTSEQNRLQTQLALADNLEERERIELRIAELAGDIRDADIRAAIAKEKIAKAAEVAAAEAEGDFGRALETGRRYDDRISVLEGDLANSSDQVRADKKGVGERYSGPLERYRDELDRSPKETRQLIEGYVVDELQSVEDGIADALSSAIGTKDPLINGLIRLLIQDVLLKPIAEALSQSGGGGGGIGGLFTSVVGGLFGGGRATGGPTLPGKVYKVNEYNTEGWASFAQPGRVIPLGEMNSKRGSGGATINQTVQVDARNSVNPDGFARQILAISGQQANQAAAAYSQATYQSIPQRINEYNKDGI